MVIRMDIPDNDDDLMTLMESFIDDKGKINMEAMKIHGYDDSQVYDIMNAYFLATARHLAAYRKKRKSLEATKHFFEEANHLFICKIEAPDINLSDVFESVTDKTYEKCEKAFKFASTFNQDNKGLKKADRQNKTYFEGGQLEEPILHVRKSSSAPEISPSTYFKGKKEKKDSVKSTQSSPRLYSLLKDKKKRKDIVNSVSRVPTPYPLFGNQKSKSESPTSKTTSLPRENSPMQNCTSDIDMTVFNKFMNMLKEPSSKKTDEEASKKRRNESIKISTDGCAATDVSSSLSSCIQDYVKINIEANSTNHSCRKIDSHTTSSDTSNASSMQPPLTLCVLQNVKSSTPVISPSNSSMEEYDKKRISLLLPVMVTSEQSIICDIVNDSSTRSRSESSIIHEKAHCEPSKCTCCSSSGTESEFSRSTISDSSCDTKSELSSSTIDQDSLDGSENKVSRATI